MNQKNGGNEAAAAAVSSGNSIEFLLCVKVEYGMTGMRTTKQVFPDSHKLLTEPTIWIGGDTVATMDMTPYMVGMINKKEAKESVSIVMGNKQVEKSIANGNILSMVCENLTENAAQHTFKAPCCCFENAPNTDLVFF